MAVTPGLMQSTERQKTSQGDQTAKLSERRKLHGAQSGPTEADRELYGPVAVEATGVIPWEARTQDHPAEVSQGATALGCVDKKRTKWQLLIFSLSHNAYSHCSWSAALQNQHELDLQTVKRLIRRVAVCNMRLTAEA